MVRSALLPLICIICFATAVLFHQRISYPIIQIAKQDVALNFKAETISLLSIGFKRLLSDIMWIQTLMESDTDHYKKKDLNSWLYLRFSTIAKLDPLFYENYNYGGQYLMIIKDDLIGAEKLLTDGTKYYPDDISLNWQLGFMFAIELSEFEKSLPFLDRIKYNPGRPPMFDSLYTKIATNSLGPKEALNYAKSMWEKHKDGEVIKERLAQQVYTLKAMIDLDCLNSKDQINCDRYDFHGNPYIKKEGHFSAPQKLVPMKFKINSRREQYE